MKITKRKVDESVDSIYNHTKDDEDFIVGNNNYKYSYKCSHDVLDTVFVLSDAGNIVAKRKCSICGTVTDNYIFRPVVAEHFDDELGWIQK